MNCYCHCHLAKLKKGEAHVAPEGGEAPAAGRHQIPYAFPFNLFVMPHYTGEMITWTGFAVASGFNLASIVIWVLSLCVLQIWTHSRREQYINMYKEDEATYKGKKSPEGRW